MTKYHVGIDLHKTVAQICVVDAQGEIVVESRHGLAGPAEGQLFVEHLAQWRSGRFAVEAIGSNRWFVNACRERGLEVFVVHAAALGLKRSGKKTDKFDAREIARRLYLGDLQTRSTGVASCSGSGTDRCSGDSRP